LKTAVSSNRIVARRQPRGLQAARLPLRRPSFRMGFVV
jgi:hypothetical protein